MINCKYNKSIMCSVDDFISKICKGCKNYVQEDFDALFLYEVKCALSNYITSKQCDEKQGLLMLNEIMKDLIDDYIQRGGKNDR